MQSRRPADGSLTIVLKYGRDRSSAIDGLKRVSRPGRRVYVKHTDLPKVMSGMGISIISTSRGVLTTVRPSKEASAASCSARCGDDCRSTTRGGRSVARR